MHSSVHDKATLRLALVTNLVVTVVRCRHHEEPRSSRRRSGAGCSAPRWSCADALMPKDAPGTQSQPATAGGVGASLPKIHGRGGPRRLGRRTRGRSLRSVRTCRSCGSGFVAPESGGERNEPECLARQRRPRRTGQRGHADLRRFEEGPEVRRSAHQKRHHATTVKSVPGPGPPALSAYAGFRELPQRPSSDVMRRAGQRRLTNCQATRTTRRTPLSLRDRDEELKPVREAHAAIRDMRRRHQAARGA
jgi:hypothetical protein